MNIECEQCIKRKTMYCPNSSECYELEDKPQWQNRIMLLEENQSLKDRTEKAIAYIKELDDETDDTIYDIDRSVKNELLLLLKFDERKANELIAKADDLLKGDK